MPTASTSSTATADVSADALDRHLDEALMMALALSDGRTAAVVEALLFARKRSRAEDGRAQEYLADSTRAAVAFKDACGERSVVMSSASRLSPLNRITSAKDGQLSSAVRLVNLWSCEGGSGVAKPKAQPGSISAAEWEEASALKCLLQTAVEATQVEQLLMARSPRVIAMAFAMQALDELVDDVLLQSLSHPRRSLQDEVCALFPLLMSARAQGLTPEGLITLTDRAIGLPFDRNKFSYRRTRKGKA